MPVCQSRDSTGVQGVRYKRFTAVSSPNAQEASLLLHAKRAQETMEKIKNTEVEVEGGEQCDEKDTD